MDKTVNKYHEKSHPSEWYVVADELRHSVNVLFKDRSITETIDVDGKVLLQKPTISKGYFLLAGFAIENLIKGLLITENVDLKKDGKINNSISQGHNLKSLAIKLKSIELNDLESELLDILSEAIPYWARYPVPKIYQKLSSEVPVSKITHDTFSGLFNKLKSELIKLSTSKWIDPNGKETSWSTKDGS